jgi:hypothetical protein
MHADPAPSTEPAPSMTGVHVLKVPTCCDLLEHSHW